MLRQWTRR